MGTSPPSASWTRSSNFAIRSSGRGLGRLPKSALKLRPEWADFDAEKRFAMTERAVTDNKACACGAILRGEKTPEQCPLFGRACNPANPIGACMVSSEGACAAAWSLRPTPRRSAREGEDF